MRENADQNNSEYGHFSRSVRDWVWFNVSTQLNDMYILQYVIYYCYAYTTVLMPIYKEFFGVAMM